MTTRSCSVNFKISELGHLTCAFLYFRKKTRSLQSQCTREDCICYISTVNFILKWLCALKVTKRKCLLLPGSSLACSFLQHGAANCSVHHACTFWSWVREQWDCCWGLLAQDITARSFHLAILQVEFEDVSAFFPTLWHGVLLLRACMSNLGWCERALGTHSGGWAMAFAPLLNAALGGTGLGRQTGAVWVLLGASLRRCMYDPIISFC